MTYRGWTGDSWRLLTRDLAHMVALSVHVSSVLAVVVRSQALIVIFGSV